MDGKPSRAAAALIAGAALVAAISACGSSNDSSNDSSGGSSTATATSGSKPTSVKGKTVILNAAGDANPWTKKYNHTIIDGLEAAGAKVTYLQDAYNPTTHLNNLNSAIARKPDLILELPQDPKSLIPALKRAKAANVPVIQLDNNPIPEEDGLLAGAIQPDNEALGKYGAQALVDGLKAQGKTKANIAVVTGGPALIATQRFDALKEAIKAHPGFKIAGTVENIAWDTATSQKVLPPLLAKLKSKGGVQAVYTMSDDTATGARNAIKQTGGTLGGDNGIIVAASNCSATGIDAIMSGEQAGTASQAPGVEGEFVVPIVVKFLSGQKIPPISLNQEVAITKANAAEWKAKCTY